MLFDDKQNNVCQQTSHSISAVPFLACHDNEISAKLFTMPEWPPSIRAAVDSAYMDHHVAQIDDAETTLYSSHVAGQAAANAPFSFHHRSLQMALLQAQHGLEVLFEDYPVQLSQPKKADLVIGSFDDLLSVVESQDVTDIRFDDTGYATLSWLQSFAETNSAEYVDGNTCHLCSLQYHLIRTRSQLNIKKNVVDVRSPRSSVEHVVRPSLRYVLYRFRPPRYSESH
jgi:hypothetical protein